MSYVKYRKDHKKLREILICHLYKNGYSFKYIAFNFFSSYGTVRRAVVKNNIKLRNLSEASNLSLKLGIRKSGSESTLWKGGTHICNGYTLYNSGKNKGRGVHTVLMESKIKRKIRKNECVHHINRDRSDNRIENLMLMNNGDHIRLHKEKKLVSKSDLLNALYETDTNKEAALLLGVSSKILTKSIHSHKIKKWDIKREKIIKNKGKNECQ